MSSKKGGAARMSEADLLAFKSKNGANRVHDPMEGRAALRALGIPEARFNDGPQKVLQRGVSDPALAALMPVLPSTSNNPDGSTAGTPADAPKVKAKRRGIEMGPITASLKRPVREALVGATENGPTLSLWLTGARMLTVNDLFAILQVRKHESWRYKARWKALIAETLATADPTRPLPFFDGPTRVTLFRRGTNKIDLDSFQTVFKYAIDGLRKCNVLLEDHPELVVETIPIQQTGEPAVGLRLERLLTWERPPVQDVHALWFGTVEPPQPPVIRVRERAKTSRRKGVPESFLPQAEASKRDPTAVAITKTEAKAARAIKV